MIVEVISESTRRTDETEKRDAYLAIPTLMAYLLVEPDRMQVVAHVRLGPDEPFERKVLEGEDATIVLSTFEVNLLVADLYDGVSLS